MISFIKGNLVSVGKGSIVVENNGIGFNVFIPESIINLLPSVGSDVMIHTYFLVKEDAMNLYGFFDRQDLEIFRLLLTVNGIGPKGALAILSTITPDELRFAVLSGDSKAISKAPGVGNKTAQKLIIELKDKLNIEDIIESGSGVSPKSSSLGTARNEAIEAMVALGYSQSEAYKAVSKVDSDGLTTEAIIKIALKSMI